MKIINNTIYLKTVGINYFKERDNLKCNTMRRFDNWEELKAFQQFKDEFESKYLNEKTIHVSWDTEGFFERKITDISKYEGYYIISWEK